MRKIEATIWLLIFICIGVIHACVSPFIKIVAVFLVFFGTGKYKQYGVNVWEGFDNSVSAETGGDPDDSLSSRLGKARERNSGWSLITVKVNLVFKEFFNDENHCYRVMERDEGKKQVTTY
jgi:hypothetical protein